MRKLCEVIGRLMYAGAKYLTIVGAVIAAVNFVRWPLKRWEYDYFHQFFAPLHPLMVSGILFMLAYVLWVVGANIVLRSRVNDPLAKYGNW